MKTKMNLLKTAVLALVLAAPAQIFAQVFPNNPTTPISAPADLNGGTVTFDGSVETYDNNPTTNTVAYYKPNTAGAGSVTGVTLKASLNDNGVLFTNYIWYEISNTAGAETQTQIGTGSTNTFTVSNLTPGYHKFRVRGEVGGVLACPTTEYQDMIVFVLPELNVGLSDVTGTLTYCEDDVPTGANAVELSAGTITADYTGNNNDYPKPGATDAAADFSLTYHWYAIPASNPVPSSYIDLGTATTATVDLTTLLTASSTSLSPDIYNFYVEVEYANSIRDNSVGRTYVVYGDDANATTSQVVITATPSTPTITVDSVTD